ncbi:MAG: hypothetical protein K6A30_02475 [Lachnospiraceae bacterium]|nr:hypothetical protein [Lachnospiraceae bacterium]
MDHQETLNMTYSGIMRRGKEKVVYVRFERTVDGQRQYAEATIGDCEFGKVFGFSEEEIASLKFYLKENMHSIFEQAQKINDKEFWLK